MCADLDQEVGAFRDRDLSTLKDPYVFLDTTYCTARVNHRVVSQAVVVAFGIVVFQGSAWQRCRVHFIRNVLSIVLSIVPKASQETVASIIRTAFAGFPVKHWWQIWSANPMERVNKEIKRRTDVVGVFPNPAALNTGNVPVFEPIKEVVSLPELAVA